MAKTSQDDGTACDEILDGPRPIHLLSVASLKRSQSDLAVWSEEETLQGGT